MKLNIEMPDDLTRSLQTMAVEQHKTIQQLATESLRSLVEINGKPRAGSPSALLRATTEPPRLTNGDVEDLEAAIAGGRMSIKTNGVFSD